MKHSFFEPFFSPNFSPSSAGNFGTDWQSFGRYYHSSGVLLLWSHICTHHFWALLLSPPLKHSLDKDLCYARDHINALSLSLVALCRLVSGRMVTMCVQMLLSYLSFGGKMGGIFPWNENSFGLSQQKWMVACPLFLLVSNILGGSNGCNNQITSWKIRWQLKNMQKITVCVCLFTVNSFRFLYSLIPTVATIHDLIYQVSNKNKLSSFSLWQCGFLAIFKGYYCLLSFLEIAKGD